MKKIKMETAIFWLTLIGSIVIGVAVGVYYGTSKIGGIWVAFAGCALLLIAATVQWQKNIESNEAAKVAPLSVSPPHVDVKFDDSAKQLIVDNLGDKAFYLCGWQIASEPPSVAKPPQMLRGHEHTFRDAQVMRKWALNDVGQNGKERLPFTLFMLDEDKRTKFVGKFGFFVQVSNGNVTIWIQLYDVIQEDWHL